MAHRWPTDGPPPFRVIDTQGSNTKCMKCHFLVHSIRPATLFRESATCSISDEKIHRRVPIFSCSFSTFSRRKRPGSLKFAIVLAVIMSFAHVKEGVRFHFSLKNFFFVSHAGGRQIADFFGRVPRVGFMLQRYEGACPFSRARSPFSAQGNVRDH